jgi:hypothetical protein
VLWLAAVAAFAGLLAVLLGGRSDDALDDPSLWVAGGALVLAGGLYLLERRVLQQVALFAAVVATMVTAGDELGWPWDRVEGYGFLVLGLAWLELGRRGLVGPRRTSEALGSLVLLSGPEVLDAGGAGPWAWWCSWVSSPASTGATLAPLWPSCWSGWAWSWPRWCWPGGGGGREGKERGSPVGDERRAAAARPQSRTAVRALTMPRP